MDAAASEILPVSELGVKTIIIPFDNVELSSCKTEKFWQKNLSSFCIYMTLILIKHWTGIYYILF